MNAVVLTLGGVDIEDGVPGRVQVECGREEVNNREKQVEVVEELGLITCERIVYRHGAILPFCVNAVVLTLGGVDIEDGVPGRVQVECGREEVNDGEKQEKDRRRTNNAQTHIMDGMEME